MATNSSRRRCELSFSDDADGDVRPSGGKQAFEYALVLFQGVDAGVGIDEKLQCAAQILRRFSTAP